MTRKTVGLLLCLLTVGCGQADPSSNVARTVGALEVFGAEVGAPTISRLGDWTIDRNGTLYLADSRSSIVFTRQSTGVWDSIGRSGGGPGEFSAISGLAVDSSSRLWVSDSRTRLLSVFLPDGRLDTIISWATERVDPPRHGVFDNSGRLAGVYFQRVDRTNFRRTIVRSEGPLWQPTIQSLIDVPTEQFEIRRSDGQLGMVAEVPFTARLLWALAVDGDVYVANSLDYRIIRLSPSGDTVAILSRSAALITLPDAARTAALVEAIGENWANHLDVDPERVPKTFPPLLRLVAADDGRLLVERPTLDTQGSSYDIFSRDGKFVGPVHLPIRLLERYRTMVVDSAIWGVLEDRDGIPQVVRIPFR